MTPLVSIIIPTFNSAAYIRACLDSVLAQTYKDYEVLVVDDGSQDDTVEILHSYGNRIRLERQSNLGPAAARNRGIRSSQGQLICFLDSDDLWLPEKLEKQVEFVSHHPDFGLISTEASTFNEKGEILHPFLKRSMYRITGGMVAEELLFGNWVQTSGVMIPRRCFEEIGFFYEERGVRGTDWIMWVQIADRYPAYFIPEPLVRIRILENSFSHGDPEKQFWTLFRSLEIIKRTTSLSSASINKAASRICIKRGYEDLAQGRFDQARAKLKHSVTHRPQSFASWALLASAYLPFIWRLAKTSKRALRVPSGATSR